MKKVCHITSVHRSNDTRILKKQCTSLSKNGYPVYLIAKGNSYTENGVTIIGVPDSSKNRFDRMLNFSRKIYMKSLEVDADIYHLHDPELLPFALKLKKKGKVVIFDSHEDYGDVFMEKHYLPKICRKTISVIFNKYLKYISKRIDAVICCYHQTQKMLNGLNNNTPLIFNFPIIPEKLITNPYCISKNLCYAGELVPDFNHHTIIKAIQDMDAKYILAGKHTNYIANLLNDKTEYLGMIPFEDVQKIYERSSIGVCVLSYIRQCGYKKGNLSNNKFFEYMLAGLPIICTDFELWQAIVTKYDCGITVNPQDTQGIKNAIEYLLSNPEHAARMGKNGKRAVLTEFNWLNEEKKLLILYASL